MPPWGTVPADTAAFDATSPQYTRLLADIRVRRGTRRNTAVTAMALRLYTARCVCARQRDPVSLFAPPPAPTHCPLLTRPHDIAATMTTRELDGSLTHHIFQFCIPCIKSSPQSTCYYNSSSHSNPNAANGSWAVNNVGDSWQHATSKDLVTWTNHGNQIGVSRSPPCVLVGAACTHQRLVIRTFPPFVYAHAIGGVRVVRVYVCHSPVREL